MRQSEEMPLDPEVLAELEAIDATLAGEPVDPAYAELAELALLLAMTRELPSEQFTRTLDARVARHFAEVPVAASPRQRARARLSLWSRRPAFTSALAGGLAAVVVASVIATGALSSGPARTAVNGGAVQAVHKVRTPVISYNSGTTSADTTTAGTIGGTATFGGEQGSERSAAPSSKAPASGASVPSATNLTQAAAGAIPTPATGTATHVIQSAQLQLTTPNAHIDQVAQEVFNVVSLENGTVTSSQVTQASGGGNGGSYASFSLSIPTSNLQQAMTRLSALHYTAVSSRFDGTQNVSGQYAADQRHIADQKAVRTALLKQLQTAYAASAIDSLQAQLKYAEQQLSSDQAALAALQHRIGYSSLQVQVNAGPIVFASGDKTANRGFTVGRAAHDSVRVLVVAAGVALIALAVMVPLGLAAALGAWVAYWLRRRRRQQALDAA